MAIAAGGLRLWFTLLKIRPLLFNLLCWRAVEDQEPFYSQQKNAKNKSISSCLIAMRGLPAVLPALGGENVAMYHRVYVYVCLCVHVSEFLQSLMMSAITVLLGTALAATVSKT
jgi:hypothetical protein